MLEVVNLTKKYGNKKVVNNLNLSVGKGEVFGFLGPNGAGKTTTMKILLGLVKPDSGTAKVNGYDIIHDVLNVRRSCGVLPDPYGFYDNLTARYTLRFYGGLYDLRGKDLEKKVSDTLDLVGLGDVKDKHIGTFSKGMKQRFGIAQAIVHDPQVIFLDEPTAGIDPQGAEDYRALVRDLKNRGKTIFMTSHILSEVEAVCDRIGIIMNGEMKLCGNVEDILKQHNQEHGYHLRLKVKDIDETSIRSSLKNITTISQVIKNNGNYVINANQDVSEEISRAVNKANGIITELEINRPTLNDIFLEITRPRAKS